MKYRNIKTKTLVYNGISVEEYTEDETVYGRQWIAIKYKKSFNAPIRQRNRSFIIISFYVYCGSIILVVIFRFYIVDGW